MKRNPQASENATRASLSAEHHGLVELLENIRELILLKNDLPAIRSALDELAEYGRWEFGLEKAAFDYLRPEDRASHHQEHAVLLEKLWGIDRGVDQLQDPERADLCDCLSDWLVHTLSERTPSLRVADIRAEENGHAAY